MGKEAAVDPWPPACRPCGLPSRPTLPPVGPTRILLGRTSNGLLSIRPLVTRATRRRRFMAATGQRPRPCREGIDQPVQRELMRI